MANIVTRGAGVRCPCGRHDVGAAHMQPGAAGRLLTRILSAEMLTVLVATRNGAGTLPHVLEGYQETAFAAWRLEAGDRRQRQHRRHARRGSSVQVIASVDVLRRASPGKNRALLTALREAEGDLFVFSDDDAIPDPAWLVSLRRAADERADFDVFAGTIRPRWEVRPERWVLDDVDLAACYSITDPAQLAGPIRPALVAGPNMAIRRRVFEQGYRFDPEVGPSGGDYAMGSETDLTVRLGEAGFKVWFCPEAVVEHFIRAHQIEPKWILERAIRFGRGMYRRRLQRQVERPGCGSASRAISAGRSPRKRCGTPGPSCSGVEGAFANDGRSAAFWAAPSRPGSITATRRDRCLARDAVQLHWNNAAVAMLP